MVEHTDGRSDKDVAGILGPPQLFKSFESMGLTMEKFGTMALYLDEA